MSFIRIILRIYEQLIEGIGELFAVGIRQKNLMDFNNIFLNEKDEIKLGNLKDLEWHPQDSFKEFALQTLKDVEAITYKLFFEENPFFRSGKRSTNRGRNEVLKKIEEFFLKTFKGKNLDELTANMNTFFQVLTYFI